MSLKEQAAENQRNAFTLGVDIGGTKVAAGLVDARGTILFQTRAAMAAQEDAAAGFAAVERAINSVFEKHPEAHASLAGIGICAPGPLDPIRGVVLNPPNLPCWRNFPLAAEVQRAFHVGAKVDNDANAAALAEAVWGAGAGFRNVLYARYRHWHRNYFRPPHLPRAHRQRRGRRARQHRLQRPALRLRKTRMYR